MTPKQKTNEQIKALGEQYLMPIFGRVPVCMVKGKGSYLWDADGKKYLDLLAGIAVNALGHGHPDVEQAVTKSAKELLHCSNYFWIEPQVELAQWIIDHCSMDQIFFSNSGAEANEGAIKLARKASFDRYGADRYEIITMKQSFHGRTLATLTATGQENMHTSFQPLMPGFHYAPLNDFAALEAIVSDKTCAVMMELIQGEGGVIEADKDYVRKVAELCKERNILLILDEVQTGIGRTGSFFAYEQYEIEPDIVTLAKALGNGVPIGAVLAKKETAAHFAPGDHGTTFGGNPLATEAALATLKIILEDGFLETVQEKSKYMVQKLEQLKTAHNCIVSVRGKGLLLGLELSCESKSVFTDCLEKGLIISATAGNVLRFVPPLNVSTDEIEEGMRILDQVLTTYDKETAQ